MQFDSYLKKIQSIIETQPVNSVSNYSDISYLKSGMGEKYTWSWGHACVSLILKPKNESMITGEFDRDYPHPEVKTIINAKVIIDQ